MKPLRIAFATTNPAESAPFSFAFASVNNRLGEIINAYLWSGKDFEESTCEDFENIAKFVEFAFTSHVTIIRLLNKSSEFDGVMTKLKNAGVPVFVIRSDKDDFQTLSKTEQEDYRKIADYIRFGDKKNFENLLLYLANRFTGSDYEFGAPAKPQYEGIYHPDFDYAPTLDEYMGKKLQPDRITVGIWFHHNHVHSDDTAFVDSLIKEIETHGANVLPVFFSGLVDATLGTHGLDWIIDTYYLKEGKPVVDVVISGLMLSACMSTSGSDALDALKRLGVPVIKAVLTCNSYEDWRTTVLGLSVVDIPAQVALPEFDGSLITVPIATMDTTQINPLTGNQIIKYEPIPERINKVVRLSLNWGKLHRLPNSQRRVAIILHNYPPRNDTIGYAFGLDTSVAVLSILESMKEQGYTIDFIPESGQKLIDDVINGLTNDRRWLSPKELVEKAVAKIPKKQYKEWFDEISLASQNNMIKDWGNPPGKLFYYNGELLVAGILNANVFIALQPTRGFMENPAAIYHSPDLAMTHHYYAYYRWLRDVFKANVVIHLGAHGSLEWMPGKSVGLTESCYPDIAISDLPNVYPYIITNPAEGAQAKRRSYCCIIDHLIPVMHNADTYEEMAELEVLLQEYYHARIGDASKLPVMRKMIWEKVTQAKLNQDLEVTEAEALSDFDGFLERLHAYLHEVSDTQIRDGLHILGVGPSGSQLEEFLFTLTRLNNGSVPSLRQSLAELKGYDYEDLLANRGKLRSEGITNGDVIKNLNETSRELMRHLNAAQFDEQHIGTILKEVIDGGSSKVEACLSYVCSFLVPALEDSKDELTNTLSSCRGAYISPGPSGSMTRGMADILPTGRNFYSVDPRAIPTPAAWKVGVSLGDALLERYLKEEGKYPESIGIILWALPTMKTKGDDVAEILYLMGVKPVWEESSGRVTGLEVIPLETLKRPRIDVTTRISGMFRDAFPNIVHLIDDAVALVAALKESDEENYLAKHVESEVNERIAQGVDAEKARDEALYRVFGDFPGAYGCGVSDAIDTKNWKDQKDLCDIYLLWGSFVYSRKIFGVAVPDQFKRRLSKIKLTVKNEDAREIDILDGDDCYDYHGGMITSVKILGGEIPRSYCGDTSDPDRVKIRSTAEETCHVFRSRILNPKYIQGLKRHGYQGAAELSRVVDYVLGWDATVEVVEDWMYEKLAEKYVLDAEMQQWLKDVSPFALQNITERLLETIQRGLWHPTEEMKKELERIYLDIEGFLEGKSEKNKEA
ncbi:MAG: cobaltochelatase subunit CobN [Candidatus Bathyarchaeota archaeon]|nr:cobaltochelatase subunit CobN [Candidatus Bathyarchaeota archaeon]